jgi:hypothetical protein
MFGFKVKGYEWITLRHLCHSVTLVTLWRLSRKTQKTIKLDVIYIIPTIRMHIRAGDIVLGFRVKGYDFLTLGFFFFTMSRTSHAKTKISLSFSWHFKKKKVLPLGGNHKKNHIGYHRNRSKCFFRCVTFLFKALSRSAKIRINFYAISVRGTLFDTIIWMILQSFIKIVRAVLMILHSNSFFPMAWQRDTAWLVTKKKIKVMVWRQKLFLFDSPEYKFLI